jgi:hypothetical protein
MDLSFLFAPFEALDASLESLMHGSPLVAALVLAAVLGLRHASDPDHLVAVTSLVAQRGGDVRAGARLGASWGAGHAAVLVAVGLPLIALGTSLPGWLESSAEQLVGVVIILLAVRLLWRWLRGGHSASPHSHPPAPPHRHLHTGPHGHDSSASAQAVAIGALHGLAGTGAVVLVLIAALPSQAQALAALAVFAPMSVISMAVCTAAFSWVLTRPVLEGLVQRALVPVLAVFGLVFGAWYAGIA